MGAASADRRSIQLALLTLAVAAAAYAGSAVSPIQEAMRIALRLSDQQMGILQGPALAVPMALAAIPLGFLIDRYSRARLLLILTLSDVLGTVLTALATDFAVLCVGRCVVGLSSFAINPVAFSLVADLYRPHQRGRANMVVVVGQSAGVATVFALGGELLAAIGSSPLTWRWVMGALCGPLLIVALAVLWLREPERTEVILRTPTTRAALQELARYARLISPLLLGVLMAQAALGAEYIWAAPMLTRSFSLQADRVGAIMGVGLFVGGVLGSMVGGVLADLCEKSGGPPRTMSLLGGLSLLSLPAAAFALVHGATLASMLLCASITLVTAISVMGLTLVAVVIPNEIRGLCIALAMATCVLIGNGLAPVLVSVFGSELGGGTTSIGDALSYLCLTAGGIGVMAFGWGRRSFPQKARP